MRSIITYVLFILISQIASGQFAIIQDLSGPTSVYNKSDSNSRVIHKINLDEVFWYDDENYDSTDWIKVFIPKDKYSLGCSNYINGFIPKSQLIPLDKLSAYGGDDIIFDLNISDFDTTNRIIALENDKYVTAIDGRYVWGVDGRLPKTFISSIHAIVKGVEIEINPVLYIDLYECSQGFFSYRKGDTFFLYQANSDGAGYYEVVWVLTKSGVKQRLVVKRL